MLKKQNSGLGQIGVIVSARMGSTRLPGKALLPLVEKPMILFLLERLKKSHLLQNLILATTTLPTDDILSSLVSSAGYLVFRGDPYNLVNRYLDASEHYKIDTIIRVTGDCPFIDGEVLDYCIERCSEEEFDLATTKSIFPVGIDCEIFSRENLINISKKKLGKEHQEHLTLYFYENREKYKLISITPPSFWQDDLHIYTVDTQKDYEKTKKITEHFQSTDFTVKELIYFSNHAH